MNYYSVYQLRYRYIPTFDLSESLNASTFDPTTTRYYLVCTYLVSKKCSNAAEEEKKIESFWKFFGHGSVGHKGSVIRLFHKTQTIFL